MAALYAFLGIGAIVAVIAAAILVYAIFSAPEGIEDANGFTELGAAGRTKPQPVSTLPSVDTRSGGAGLIS